MASRLRLLQSGGDDGLGLTHKVDDVAELLEEDEHADGVGGEADWGTG